ncbi:uncharacterized protein LOC142767713 [Rhipicephalus microplus]|uniref:uncharacterized protein LOC142767713 n=1 Tax=Rhipicephalus microplus TaxID=6941 RepID=UPI003F6A703F
MASDGLCDYAFYDSLYTLGQNKLTSSRLFSADLETFIRGASKYKKTSSGMALAFEHLNDAERDLKNVTLTALSFFWWRKIFHVGILNTPELPKPMKWQQAIAVLKELDNRLEPQRELGHIAITVFAAPFPDNDWSLALARYFNKANFYPDLLIMPGHYPFGDNMIQDCLVMPPTRHPDDAVPDHAAKSYSYDLVCRHSRYTSRLKYSDSHYAMLARHATKKRTFAYDNEEGFYDKICKVKEDVHDVSFGIAAYDVDYDDYGNQCGSLNLYGRHSRLKTLRSIVDYFRTLIDEKFSERVCTSLAV